MGLCTSFFRAASKTSFNTRSQRLKPFYLGGVWKTQVVDLKGVQCSYSLKGRSMSIRLLCERYGALYLLSSLWLVRLCGLIFLSAPKMIGISSAVNKKYLFECYKVRSFQNAYIFSSELAGGMAAGLNVTYLLHLICKKMRFITGSKYSSNLLWWSPSGIGLILRGRIKGSGGARSIAGVNALCIGSLRSRILDYGCISSLSTLGLIGVKVGTMI